MDPEVTLGWIDAAKVVLEHIGCPQDLSVRMATGALRHLGQIWWDNTHLNVFKMRAIELITYMEFRREYHRKYFSATVRSKKKTNSYP